MSLGAQDKTVRYDLHSVSRGSVAVGVDATTFLGRIYHATRVVRLTPSTLAG